VGGVVAAILLTRHHDKPTTTAVTTTVFAPTRAGATTPAATSPATTARVTTTATTSAGSTTAQTTTTAPSRPATVSVPDLGSSRVQGAVDRLASSGLLVTLAYVPNELPLGTVVAESPSGGDSAPTGSHVTLNLSGGKDGTSSNSVPSVTGRSIPEALAAMKSAGLRLIFVRTPVSDNAQAGTVVGQTPAPGTRIPQHAEVLVYMGAVR
jgi:beta-lactam-binding protein with PASTA domain